MAEEMHRCERAGRTAEKAEQQERSLGRAPFVLLGEALVASVGDIGDDAHEQQVGDVELRSQDGPLLSSIIIAENDRDVNGGTPFCQLFLPQGHAVPG